MWYSFPKTPFLKDLKLLVENKGRTISFEASGPGSEPFSLMLRSYFEWLNKIGPIATFKGANVYSLYLPPVPSAPHARMVEGFLHTFFLRHPTPQAATIAITDRCQCSCIHCSSGVYSGTGSILSEDEIKKLIHESISPGVNNITLTGGDPLLRHDLENLLSFIPEDQAVSQIFTNGIALCPKRGFSLKSSGLYGLQISIDSPD
jgi:hypothetical protein